MRRWRSPTATAWPAWSGAWGGQRRRVETDRRRRNHARGRPAGRALGYRSRRLWPTGTADHPGPSPRGERPVPAAVRRHRPVCRRIAGGSGLQRAKCKVQIAETTRLQNQPIIFNFQFSICNLLLSPLCVLTATYLAIAAICWPNCTVGRTTGGNWPGCRNFRGRRASRWSPPATCIITWPSVRRCTTC